MAKDWVYCLYDMKNNEQCVLAADKRKEIAQYLGILEKNITYKRVMLKRYRLVKVKAGEKCERNGIYKRT